MVICFKKVVYQESGVKFSYYLRSVDHDIVGTLKEIFFGLVLIQAQCVRMAGVGGTEKAQASVFGSRETERSGFSAVQLFVFPRRLQAILVRWDSPSVHLGLQTVCG